MNSKNSSQEELVQLRNALLFIRAKSFDMITLLPSEHPEHGAHPATLGAKEIHAVASEALELQDESKNAKKGLL